MLNPAEVNPLALPSVPLEDRLQLPTEPCIYFAIDSQNTVQYVGELRTPAVDVRDTTAVASLKKWAGFGLPMCK